MQAVKKDKKPMDCFGFRVVFAYMLRSSDDACTFKREPGMRRHGKNKHVTSEEQERTADERQP